MLARKQRYKKEWFIGMLSIKHEERTESGVRIYRKVEIGYIIVQSLDCFFFGRRLPGALPYSI